MNDFIDDKNIPNKDTLEALEEVKYMKKHPEQFKGYNDVDKMMKEFLGGQTCQNLTKQ